MLVQSSQFVLATKIPATAERHWYSSNLGGRAGHEPIWPRHDLFAKDRLQATLPQSIAQAAQASAQFLHASCCGCLRHSASQLLQISAATLA